MVVVVEVEDEGISAEVQAEEEENFSRRKF